MRMISVLTEVAVDDHDNEIATDMKYRMLGKQMDYQHKPREKHKDRKTDIWKTDQPFIGWSQKTLGSYLKFSSYLRTVLLSGICGVLMLL